MIRIGIRTTRGEGHLRPRLRVGYLMVPKVLNPVAVTVSTAPLTETLLLVVPV